MSQVTSLYSYHLNKLRGTRPAIPLREIPEHILRYQMENLAARIGANDFDNESDLAKAESILEKLIVEAQRRGIL